MVCSCRFFGLGSICLVDTDVVVFMGRAMFGGLDNIDWQHIHHVHGKAEDFPSWRRELASESDEAWGGTNEQSALLKIWECAAHQTSIYEITPIVLLFLVELLLVIKPKHKTILMYLFSCLANSRFYPYTDDVLAPNHYAGHRNGFCRRKPL